MKRRTFIAGLSATAASLAVRAQQPAVPVVGFLDSTSEAVLVDRTLAFRKGLNEAGFVEGRNVTIVFRFAESQLDRMPGMAADLVRRQVAVIVTNNQATPAAKAATATIPIVFVYGADPVASGLVTSLNRPAGNITGVSFTSSPLNPKRLELLHELVPTPASIAVLLDPSNAAFEVGLHDIEAAARMLGRKILVVSAASEQEFDTAFATILQAGAGALFVGTGAFYVSQRRKLVALAGRHALPASYPARDFVEAGGLMAYGASRTDAYRRAGLYVGRILKGEKPGDLPVELPTKYELTINLKTAKVLGLTIPETLLATADEVVQ